MPFDFLLDVHFMDRQLIPDRIRIAGFLVEQAGFEVEGIGETVRGVHAHHQRAIAQPR
jgi:hypothetical protein